MRLWIARLFCPKGYEIRTTKFIDDLVHKTYPLEGPPPGMHTVKPHTRRNPVKKAPPYINKMVNEKWEVRDEHDNLPKM